MHESTMIRQKSGQRAITMRDVAQLAGVSQSTVSRVLNQSADSAVPISEDTVQRVYDAVKQLGYYPNLTARSLRGQKTQLLAMMIADICNPFYQVMVRNVQDIARKHHYDVLIANTDHDKQNEQHFLEGIIRRPVDGVIIIPYHIDAGDIDALIQRTNVPVVTLGTNFGHPLVDQVFGDDEKATYEGTKWLIRERGHQRIAYIEVPGTHPSIRRLRGFKRAMREAGMHVPADYVRPGDFSVDAGERAMRELIRLPLPPTAVVACNDLMALGCITTAQQMGLNVPADIAVMGFDNIPETLRIRPTLTTLAQYPAEMGERLAESLFERIEERYAGPARTFEVPCRLIVRESA
jgi:DNA-binding LacI/PurR family transcriptional regulator